MHVHIRYQRRDGTAPCQIELTPEEYFDPPDPGEALTVVSVAKHLNTHDYTPHSSDELLWTVVEITDVDEFWRVRTQLLDGKRVLMHHSQHSDGTEEIIIFTKLAEDRSHVSRVLKEPGKSWSLLVNSVVDDPPGDFTDFAGRQSFETLKAFGDVH